VQAIILRSEGEATKEVSMVMEKKELILDVQSVPYDIDRQTASFFEEPVDADAALPILRVWGRRTLKCQLLFGLGLCRVHNFLRRDDRRSRGARWSLFLFQLGVSRATVSRRVALVRELLFFFGVAALETYSFPEDELVLSAWRRLNAESFNMKLFVNHRRQALLSDYCPPPIFRPKYFKSKKKGISVNNTGVDDFILALQRQVRQGKIPFRPREYEQQHDLLSMLAQQYDERARRLRLLLSEVERLHEGKAKSGRVRLEGVMWGNAVTDPGANGDGMESLQTPSA